ncbi:MAG: Enoyl-CoA hydratase [Microbacteriaceae bacterium]|nr:Enoyl-CoA hydratase [Microbacteriaceae bacterium]
MSDIRVFDSLASLEAAVGETIGTSDWLEITQERVDQFAEATGDFQWIHVDVSRNAENPFGGTVAHGFLTLSLIPTLQKMIYRIENTKMGVNYGLNKVRFPSPVRVGKRVRATVKLVEVVNSPQGARATMQVTIDTEGGEKPACVAESLALYIFN